MYKTKQSAPFHACLGLYNYSTFDCASSIIQPFRKQTKNARQHHNKKAKRNFSKFERSQRANCKNDIKYKKKKINKKQRKSDPNNKQEKEKSKLSHSI